MLVNTEKLTQLHLQRLGAASNERDYSQLGASLCVKSPAE
ncbi:hypothetical protein LuPra_00599 [Luteitalea pratensis]|uniref:Uncharacterized protein n=1 Tax=Luteitalea pratensis TaxID=1855912 RepID=A0A143PG73_LUTPR|nr:hypothetical protein LuPra_00599 [Luteitalea pratensis]